MGSLFVVLFEPLIEIGLQLVDGLVKLLPNCLKTCGLTSWIRRRDPVGSGVIASHAQPAGNITGLTNFAPGLSSKRLEILRDVVQRSPALALWGPRPALSLLQLDCLHTLRSEEH